MNNRNWEFYVACIYVVQCMYLIYKKNVTVFVLSEFQNLTFTTVHLF